MPDATPPADPPPPNPMAAHAERTRFVQIGIVLLLALIAWEQWPTPTRQLQQRAQAYTRALDRQDYADAYAMLSPRVRQQVTQAAWEAAKRKQRAPEPGEAKVEGERGTVPLGGRPTAWVRVEGRWYLDAAD